MVWLYGNAGQTPLTVTTVTVVAGVRAEDEGADEVTATGAHTAGLGKTYKSLVNSTKHQQGGKSWLISFFSLLLL